MKVLLTGPDGGTVETTLDECFPGDVDAQSAAALELVELGVVYVGGGAAPAFRIHTLPEHSLPTN